MIHYTLNTNHSRLSPRSEVDDAIIAPLTPLLAPGRHKIPTEGDYTLVTTAAGDCLLATVYAGNRPAVTFAVAPHDAAAAALWLQLEKLYLRVTEMPRINAADFAAPIEPAGTPWCAAVVILATPDEAYWIADFERCIAWAWIEKNTKGKS